MAENENVEQQAATVEQQGDTEQQTDYKALYEQLKADSRKWEDRAKSNKEKADAYDALQAKASEQAQANKTLEEQVADIRNQLNASNAANTRLKIASEKGVPERFVFGATEDEMRENADAFLDEVAKAAKKPTAPVVPTEGKAPETKSGLSDYEQFAVNFFGGK